MPPDQPSAILPPPHDDLFPETGLRYQVRHRTLFEYAAPVSGSVNTVHLEPRPFPFQRTLSCLIKVLPATRLRRSADLLHNIIHHFEVAQPHDRLEIESHLRIQNLPLEISGASAHATAADYSDDQRDLIHPYLLPSSYIPTSHLIYQQALELTGGIASLHDRALAVMRWVHASFLYQPHATQVSTRLLEAWELRRGVCQDFSHVMIGLCRSVGIPCRYASGYLYNGPLDRLLGAQASHAWAEVYLPFVGWVGYDPTNDTMADERYIKVAIGRDYHDVAPIRGRYRGTGDSCMSVEVEVTRLD